MHEQFLFSLSSAEMAPLSASEHPMMSGILPRGDSGASEDFLQQSKVTNIIVCNVVLIVASTFGLAIRLFVRSRYLSGIGIDDAFCAIGWIFTFIECLVCIIMTNYGFGKHIDTIQDSPEKFAMFLKLDFVTEITYLFALGTIKISFCLFYLKIFPGKKFIVCCWCLIGLLTAQTIEETFVVIFQCWPVNKAWDATNEVKGSCLDLLSFFYISFGIRLATDIALFVLPIPKLLQLNMTIGKRAGLIFMFSLGTLVVITSIIRATYLNNFSLDHTWTLVDPLNWSSVELGVAIFIACFPSFKALVSYQFPGLRHMLGLSSGGQSYANRYEMYGASSSRRTGDRRSWAARPHFAQSKHGQVSTRVQSAVEGSRSGSEDHIMVSDVSQGIQVTTNVSVGLASHPRSPGREQWPLP